MNIQQMDQTHWVCYHFGHNTYYYGQVGYLDEFGVVHPKDNAEAASNPKNKLVKHGFGVYIYEQGENGQVSKYEGYWERDKKQGHGKLTLPNKTVYEGNFKDGSYHQSGKMVWPNGDSYEGLWKKSKMDGPGIFKHHEGTVLKGSFKVNYFIDENVLRNPQMSEKEYIAFKKQRKEVLKQKQKNQKVKHGFILKLKATQGPKILQDATKSNKNNRIPLIVASQASKFNILSLEKLLEQHGNKCNIFDLRKAFLLKGEQKFNYRNKFSQMTRQTLTKGETLIINLDQTTQQYKEAFYPDIKEFYDTSGFNANTWNRDLMKRKEVSSKVIGSAQINDNYQIVVWSKFKIGEDLNEDQIKEKLQLRFQSIVPFIRIDVIFVTGDH